MTLDQKALAAALLPDKRLAELIGQARVCADVARPSVDDFTYLNGPAREMLRDAVTAIEELLQRRASLPAPEPVARDDHRFAVVSSDFSRPFLAGAYPTLERAVKAQCGAPDRWPIFERYHASPPSHQGLREALETLVNNGLLSGIRALVAGWNGEAFGGFKRHPSNLGVKLPTNCGAIYELDEALEAARAALQSQPAPSGETSGWQPIETAPKDGTPIWALMRSNIFPAICPGREDLKPWNGIQVCLRHPGIADDGFDMGWNVAAPVGCGGLPDNWIVGWLPAQPLLKEGE